MMTGEEDGPNTGRWGLILGLVSGLGAGLAHAALAYYTVTGFTVDWIEWSKRQTIAADVAAAELAAATALVTLLLVGLVAAVAWALAQRGHLRGDPGKGQASPRKGWSEHASLLTIGVAATGAIAAAVLGFLAVELASPPGLEGQSFFLIQVSFGTLVVGLGAVQLTRSMANGHARDELGPTNPQGNLVSRIQLWSAENAVAVVLIALLLTGGMGYGITKITTDVNVADLMPRGNENTEAGHNVTREFKSAFTQQATLHLRTNVAQCQLDAQRVLGEQRASQIDCGNISAEPYVRATEELYRMILEDEDNPIQYTIGLNSFYKLINWTIAGGQDNPDGPLAFALPPVEATVEGQGDPTGVFETAGGGTQYGMVNWTVWNAIPTTVTPLIDPSFEQTASLYLVDASYEGTTRNIGDEMLEFKRDYVEAVGDGETTWRVWGEDNPPLFTVDIPVANAHQSDLAREDFQTLFPLIFVFIVVALYLSFRSFTAIGIAGATLGSAITITYGAMGWMGIPLNTLNLTVLPLILGTGIDFTIHQVTEFAHHKREGLSDEEALRVSGGFAGFAMFIAAATSISGLLVMTISPSLVMAQLGLLAAIAMATVYILVITLAPALLKLSRSSDGMGESFEPSGMVVSLVSMLSRRRIVVGVLIVALTAGAWVGTQHLEIEEFGEPAQNFPEDDWLREEHEEGIRGFYDITEPGATELKTNILVFEGDNTDLQAHRYMNALQANMAEKPNLNMDTSRNLPFLMRNWLVVKDGIPSAVPETARQELLGTPLDPAAQQTDPYPQTREQIIEEMDQSFASPLATFASLFVDEPDYNISVMTVATTTGDFDQAKAAWFDVQEAIEETSGQQPHDTRVAFFGNTALNFLFVEEELPWLSYLGYVSGAMLIGLTAVFTKRLRPVLAVGSVMGLTSIWWLGLLPAFDIGLAITLMLPAVFITSIGADYAIHMTWNLLRNPDRRQVYGVVGKAILFSAITDIGAFAIFTQTQNVAAAEAMVATVLAIAVMFVATILVMALFYPIERSAPAQTDRAQEDAGAPRGAQAPS